jgi:mannose-6-phosphate isomerase-like protein (cupin superfamily)
LEDVMKFKTKEGFNFKVHDVIGIAVTSDQHSKYASLAVLHVEGRRGEGKYTLGDRFYYITSGNGQFRINGNLLDVEYDDVILIPKDTPYSYHGSFKAIEVNAPAFNPDYAVELE